MSQTSYTLYQLNAFAGMLADMSDHDIISMSAEAAAIPFGKAVVLGTNREKQVRQASTSVGQGALIVGFATYVLSCLTGSIVGNVLYEGAFALSFVSPPFTLFPAFLLLSLVLFLVVPSLFTGVVLAPGVKS
jgi:ABC-type dipeptide/oligopeptide/nickel transport system permease subunit